MERLRDATWALTSTRTREVSEVATRAAVMAARSELREFLVSVLVGQEYPGAPPEFSDLPFQLRQRAKALVVELGKRQREDHLRQPSMTISGPVFPSLEGLRWRLVAILAFVVGVYGGAFIRWMVRLFRAFLVACWRLLQAFYTGGPTQRTGYRVHQPVHLAHVEGTESPHSEGSTGSAGVPPSTTRSRRKRRR